MKKWGMVSVGGAQAAIPEQTMDLLLQAHSTLHAVTELFQHSNLVENTYTLKKKEEFPARWLSWNGTSVDRGTLNRGRKVAASPRKSLPSAVALETILASFADEISPKLLCLQLLAVTPESLSLLVCAAVQQLSGGTDLKQN